MKKTFRLTTLFVCVATFIASLALSFFFFVAPVRAAQGTVFEMEYGAGVKLGENGLRFVAKMDADYYNWIVENENVKIYGYIAPTEEFDKVSEYKDVAVKVGGQLDENKIYEDDGYYKVNIAITGLDEVEKDEKYLYGRSFSAIIFIVEETGGTPNYIYADLAKGGNSVSDIALQNRTQYQVINSALLDTRVSNEEKIMSTYGAWYGESNEYPIVLDSQEDITALTTKIADSANFANVVKDKIVYVKNGLNATSLSGKVATINYGHRVNFWDGNKLLETIYVADGGSASPKTPTRDGYAFVEWVGESFDSVTCDLDIYAKWKGSKSTVKTGDMTAYGVTRADGVTISQKSDVIGQKITLAGGDLGHGAYYPGETNGSPDPTDENNTADQAYLAFDGNYGFNDYFVAEFTGKNMPTLAFFANNYNNSIFYGDGTKNGVIVSTGLTLPTGNLFTEDASYCTSVFNGAGLCMWGPHMIYSTAKNADSKGVLLHSNVENVALGRANLVSGKKYRIIIGFEPGDDASNKAIKLVYSLYDLDKNCIVEMGEYDTYNFFADGWANAGQTRDQFCQGSIVAYGYFGTSTVLDKVYDIYEDTTIDAISAELGMANGNDATINGESIVLNAGSIGAGANYTQGQNAGGSITQSYYAINGDFGFDDYVAFDFTGKNMPEVMFFAKNYDSSMYYSAGKQGVVVASGITLWDGSIGSAQSNNTEVGVSGPFGAYFKSAAAPYGGNMLSDFSAQLARANLVDDTKYRVIMGITKSGTNAFTLKYLLYDLTNETTVEEVSQTSWGFFTGSNAAVNNMILDDLSGAIVLYGKFNATCTIDAVHGVFEDTDITAISANFGLNPKTVIFANYDGSVLQQDTLSVGETPVYTGATPKKPGDAIYSSFTFKGWDKEISTVTDNVTYTATFTAGEMRDSVTVSTSKGVTQSGNGVVLASSGIGDGANYVLGQNNGGYVDQSYLALDGNYALNDYIALDFTGKNLPEIAFFAKNYNNSMYAEGTDKQGIVVVTGITTWDGQLSSGVNGNGAQINYGFPYMIQDAANGSFVSGAFASSQLGRANLVDGKRYRVIMGFTGSGSAITLHWYLYDLDASAVVEQSSMTTWNFFTGSNSQVGNMTINDLSGSIVLYGKFGTACTLDKVWGVFEDTTLDAVANGLNGSTTHTVIFKDSVGNVIQSESVAYGSMPEYKGIMPTKEDDAVFTYEAGWDKPLTVVKDNVTYTLTFTANYIDEVSVNNTTPSGDGLVLNNSSIGDSAHYSGSNNQSGVIGTVNQSYLAFDGNYSFNDYVVFDFTGKNMPSVAFFAQNYNESMYYQNGDKQGLVVLTGLTTWQGELYTEYNDSKSIWDGKGLAVAGPYMLHNTLTSGKNGLLGFQAISSNSGSNSSVALGRSNLDDSKQYRVIMGMEEGNNALSIKIVYMLYNLTDDVIVEEFSAETYNFFTTGFVKDGETRNESCQGAIVLYGHFGTTTTLDKVWGVYEDTTITDVASQLFDTGEDEGGSENPVVEGPDYSGYTDQFDFYAYSAYSDGTYEIDGQEYYIGKTLANLKQYSLYGEVGMTIYFPQSDILMNGTEESLAKAKKLLDDLAKVGITKTILQDSRILHLSLQEKAIVGAGCQFADENALDEYIYNCVKDYATLPGVYGIQLGDEPKYVCLSAYSAVYKSIKRVNQKYGFNLFVQYNLNPLNVSEAVYTNYYPASSGTYDWNNFRYKLGWRDIFTDTVTRYTQYINDFLTAMNPDSIMYDDYPLMVDKNGNLTISDSYIPCLQIVAKAAADRGIKFYNVTQAFKNNADGTIHRRTMTEKGAKWLNNILLGFGAKQIAYYTYYTRSESDSSGGESYVDGQSFVDYNGNPTDLYYWMQNIIANDQKFAPTVMQFDYKGSKVYGSTSLDHLAEITVSNSFTKLSACSTNGSTLVTELYDDENDYYMYMAMNVADPDGGDASQTVTMTFSGYTKVLVYVDGVATKHTLNSNKFTATLTAGDAVFVIPYN